MAGKGPDESQIQGTSVLEKPSLSAEHKEGPENDVELQKAIQKTLHIAEDAKSDLTTIVRSYDHKFDSDPHFADAQFLHGREEAQTIALDKANTEWSGLQAGIQDVLSSKTQAEVFPEAEQPKVVPTVAEVTTEVKDQKTAESQPVEGAIVHIPAQPQVEEVKATPFSTTQIGEDHIKKPEVVEGILEEEKNSKPEIIDATHTVVHPPLTQEEIDARSARELNARKLNEVIDDTEEKKEAADYHVDEKLTAVVQESEIPVARVSTPEEIVAAKPAQETPVQSPWLNKPEGISDELSDTEKEKLIKDLDGKLVNVGYVEVLNTPETLQDRSKTFQGQEFKGFAAMQEEQAKMPTETTPQAGVNRATLEVPQNPVQEKEIPVARVATPEEITVAKAGKYRPEVQVRKETPETINEEKIANTIKKLAQAWESKQEARKAEVQWQESEKEHQEDNRNVAENIKRAAERLRVEKEKPQPVIEKVSVNPEEPVYEKLTIRERMRNAMDSLRGYMGEKIHSIIDPHLVDRISDKIDRAQSKRRSLYLDVKSFDDHAKMKIAEIQKLERHKTTISNQKSIGHIEKEISRLKNDQERYEFYRGAAESRLKGHDLKIEKYKNERAPIVDKVVERLDKKLQPHQERIEELNQSISVIKNSIAKHEVLKQQLAVRLKAYEQDVRLKKIAKEDYAELRRNYDKAFGNIFRQQAEAGRIEQAIGGINKKVRVLERERQSFTMLGAVKQMQRSETLEVGEVDRREAKQAETPIEAESPQPDEEESRVESRLEREEASSETVESEPAAEAIENADEEQSPEKEKQSENVPENGEAKAERMKVPTKPAELISAWNKYISSKAEARFKLPPLRWNEALPVRIGMKKKGGMRKDGFEEYVNQYFAGKKTRAEMTKIKNAIGRFYKSFEPKTKK